MRSRMHGPQRAGDFEILIGASSRDIRLNGLVTLMPAPRASRLHTGLTD